MAHDELGLVAAWFPSEIDVHADVSVDRRVHWGAAIGTGRGGDIVKGRERI